MKYKKYMLLLLTVMLFATIESCKKLESYQIDPNSPSQASASLLLTNICVSTFYPDATSAAYASRHLTYYERPNVYINYSWARSGFGNYNTLRQVKAMDEAAQKSGQDNYRALAKLFRAIHFIALTETFGDIPYSDALNARDGVDNPKYDTQEDVYAGCLKELEEANNMIDPAKGDLVGDIIYQGKPLQWKKLINAFHLRVLMHLSKKENNTRLNIKAQFKQIVDNPAKYPLFISIADNARLTFNKDAKENYYPTFQSTSVASLVSIEKGFATILKDRKDPRLFKFAQPVRNTPSAVPGAQQRFEDYEGVDAGLTVANQANAAKNASQIAKRYFDDPVNEPYIFMGYAEQEFIIAEAIIRNWITGDATQHYKNGITASMKFYGISDADIANYLAQPSVQFNAANGIPLIITQKYISFFINSGWEPFYDQRRTGIPQFSIGPGTLNGGKIPKRWMYPQNELNYNGTNVQDAIQRQYPAGDNINGEMWLIKD